jgi:hypothetical protein
VHLPEGQLTRTGEINEFKGGVAKIVERSKVPVIPMALRGLWGLLSRKQDNVFERVFRKGLRSRLALAVGAGGAAGRVAGRSEQRVAALRGDWK